MRAMLQLSRNILFVPLLLLLPFRSFPQALISEFNAAPAAGEPEWIEIYNPDSRELVLSNITLHDNRSFVRIAELRVPARGYTLITRDTAALREVRAIPVSARLLEVKHPSLNNTSDNIVLRNADSLVIDSVYYSMRWGTRGVSLERRDMLRPAVTADNLFPSHSRDSATAGYLNSVALLDRDARLKRFRLNGILQHLELTVENYGRLPLGGGTLRIELIAASPREIYSAPVPALAPADSAVYTVPFEPLKTHFPSKGNFILRAQIQIPNDERSSNDTVPLSFFSSYPYATIRFNEIMFDPEADGAEFVELWNSSDERINLDGWSLQYRPGSKSVNRARLRHRWIEPNELLVVAWDESIITRHPELAESGSLLITEDGLTLNAAGDEIYLLDPNGLVIDQVAYSPSWHARSVVRTRGVSLEKVNKNFPSEARDSWTSSGAGATPGRENSVALDPATSGSLTATPNPFSPRDAGGRNFTVISYRIPFAVSTIQVQIFSESGILLRRLINALYTDSEGNFLWDGRDEGGNELPAGTYVAHLEAVRAGQAEVYAEKILIVIGK